MPDFNFMVMLVKLWYLNYMAILVWFGKYIFFRSEYILKWLLYQNKERKERFPSSSSSLDDKSWRKECKDSWQFSKSSPFHEAKLRFFSPAKKRTSHQDCGLKWQTMANPLHIDADVVFHCKNKIDVYLIIFCSFKKFFQQNSSVYHIFINKWENLTSEKCITLLFRKPERKKGPSLLLLQTQRYSSR